MEVIPSIVKEQRAAPPKSAARVSMLTRRWEARIEGVLRQEDPFQIWAQLHVYS